MSEERAKAALEKLFDTFEKKGETFFAVTGDGSDSETSDVAGRPGWTWVRLVHEQGRVTEVRNRRCTGIAQDVPVVVARIYDGGPLEIIDIKFSYYEQTMEADTLANYLLPAHAASHIINEDLEPSDPIWIYPRAIVPLRARPPDVASVTVYIESGELPYTDQPYWAGGASPDMSGDLPAAGNQAWYTIYLARDGTANYTKGADHAPGVDTSPPDPPDDSVPICYVLLQDASATIDETMIWDARRLSGAMYSELEFANPTASVGLAAVNGVLETAMRSDAAPPLDQAITPTWTGAHIHQNSVELGAGGSFDVNGIADGLVLDADGDTTLSAPVDDQIDIEVAGADDFTITANSFNVLAGSVINLDGVADALVLDDDGDTTISAPTDDQIDIEMSGADIFQLDVNGIWYQFDGTIGRPGDVSLSFDAVNGYIANYLDDNAGADKVVIYDSGTNIVGYIDSNGKFWGYAGGDFHPNADGRGLAARLINPPGLTTWTAHFRPAETTGPGNGTLAAYSWAGAPFITPSTIAYSASNDYLSATDASATYRSFLYRSITNAAANWQNKTMNGRFRTGLNTAIGLRLDDGTDTNWIEIYMTGALANATQRLDFRTNAGTTSSGVIIPCDSFVVIQLFVLYNAGTGAYTAYGYIVSEDGSAINVTGFIATITAWVPAAGRAGIVLRNDTGSVGNPGRCDWFYNEFT